MTYEIGTVTQKLRGAVYSLATLTLVAFLGCAKTEGTSNTTDTSASASSTVASSSSTCPPAR